MVIVTLNNSESRGGAANIARSFYHAFSSLGHKSYFVVGNGNGNNGNVFQVQHEKHWGWWRRMVTQYRARIVKMYGNEKWLIRGISYILLWCSDFPGRLRHELGVEEFNYPGVRAFFDRASVKPDIVHLHMPKGGFFDLRYLPELSNRFPVFYTLHGAWLLAGHCAHSFDCERWKIGCGHCPDLSIPDPIKRDSSKFNWRRKSLIYRRSKLYVATPCHWLMNKVKESMLAPACIELRVIPHGVDHSIFFPSDKLESRKHLGINQDDFVFLFAANGAKRNIWKDFDLLEKAIKLIDGNPERKVTFLVLGDNAERFHSSSTCETIFIPYCDDPKRVSSFFSAADVYLHASKVDTFPTVILEALACGTPVIATSVGGIPEQIKGLRNDEFVCEGNSFTEADATGILVPPSDPMIFANAMKFLMDQDEIRIQLGKNAAEDSRDRFSSERTVQSYLNWYKEVLNKNA